MSEIVGGRFDGCSPEERLEALEQLGALISATTAELVVLVGASDRAGDWKLDGATGMAPWLVDALRVSSATAREWVRAGERLVELSEVGAAFGTGVLSWEQVRPACRFVTPDTDAVMARELPGCTVAQVETMARQHRPRQTFEDLEAARVRRIRWRPDHVLGGYRYSGFLPTLLAEHVNQVLTRMAETAGPDAETGVWDPFEVRAADALVELGRVRAGIDPDPDSCLVVIHTDAEVVDGHVDGNGMVGDLPVSRETVLRVLCDCKIEFSIDGPDGTTVGIGRADRNVPRWLRRKVAHRDGTCRFPGCGRLIRHRHHVKHWTKGGPTDADNLIGVCWEHHHLVHEGGWIIQGHPDHEVTFVSPTGRRCSSRARPVQPRIHQRARQAAGLAQHARAEAGADPPPSSPR